MANPTCTLVTLVDNAACYRQSALNPIQQKALLVYAKVLELEAIGGTDYTAALTTTLLEDTACPPYTADHIRAANVAVAFNNADAAGATVPTDIQDALAAVKCLQHVPGGMATLDRIDVFLNCSLGQSKAYPQ